MSCQYEKIQRVWIIVEGQQLFLPLRKPKRMLKDHRSTVTILPMQETEAQIHLVYYEGAVSVPTIRVAQMLVKHRGRALLVPNLQISWRHFENSK
jgi:hypothetical protein